MIAPMIHMLESTHKRTPHSPLYQRCTPNSTHAPIKQTHKIIHPHQCKKTKPLDPNTSQFMNGYSDVHAPPSHACAWLELDHTSYMCIGSHVGSQPPLTPHPLNIVEFIEFTCCHNRFSHQRTQRIIHSYKYLKWHDGESTCSTPLSQVLGEPSTNTQFRNGIASKYPQARFKLTNHICQIAIKYLTYLH